QLHNPANADFVNGAVWYLGEVMRTAKGGEWHYRSPTSGSRGPDVGRPYVQQPTEHGSTTAPILALKNLVDRRPPGYLRKRYADFAR
ncbi:MAG: hypothetical protein LC808_40460, partial [Actinobacteria bacterium]|nr:hypothetical protein [Actinomycetota bacterium]